MRRALPVLACMALAACAAPETARRADPGLTLPPMKAFDRASPIRPQVSNAIIARDFLDLVFTLENGDEVPVFTRFEGPVTVRVLGPAPPSLRPDLARLLERLRREARIDISEVPADAANASITIQPVRRSQIRRVAPSAACFVRPNVTNWSEYRARRNDPRTFWRNLTRRQQMAIFLPADVSPQEIRDCLHEEISQALGPVNDLYRLTQSIFNDDNYHTVLTGYDMLILRAHYDRALRSGMTKPEVAARLPGILARLNPEGGASGIAAPVREFPPWRAAIDVATRPGLAQGRRIAAARRAVRLAESFGPTDPRRAFSHYVLGRLLLSQNPDRALASFLAAGRIYQNRPDTSVQEAHVAMQIAAFQLSGGRPDIALRIIDRNIGAVRQAEHAALLSLMLLIKAEALELLARPEEAARVQSDALAWARYGFGSDDEVLARVAEIRAISPRTRRGNPA